jgi:hypothetical protein
MAASSGVWETPHKRRHRHGLISGSQTLDPNQGRIQEIERRAGAAALASWRGRISVAGRHARGVTVVAGPAHSLVLPSLIHSPPAHSLERGLFQWVLARRGCSFHPNKIRAF